MSKYWKCTRKLSSKILAMWAIERKVINEAIEYSASIGASEKSVVTSRAFGVLHVVGFHFESNPGKGWKKLKLEDFWRPKSGTEAWKRMNEFRGCFVDDLCTLVGLNESKGELYWGVTTGVRVSEDKHVLLALPDDFTPCVGMKRVSDIEWEQVDNTRTKAAS